jgi:hypothetical protein
MRSGSGIGAGEESAMGGRVRATEREVELECGEWVLSG